MKNWKPSARLEKMGSAIFAEVAEWKAEAARSGWDVIDLGIGSPDQPPSEAVREALSRAVRDPGVYGYPSSEGSPAFRRAVADWYAHRFGVMLDPESEVLALMGSQDGLAHLAMAVTDPGDVAIVPDPGYPIYQAGLELAGVTPYLLPLTAENGFLPDLDGIPADVARRAAFLLCNYPSNPLAATAGLDTFERLVRFARDNGVLLVHDAAYSEMAFDGFRPPSVLQVDGAKEVAVEFHSMSKSFNMAGCRIALAVGNRDAIRALRTLKSNIDYGVFEAVQQAAIAAMEEDRKSDHNVSALYEARRDLLVNGLREAGWDVPTPKATMFLWAPIPDGWTSRQISREILEAAGVAVIPGDAFGTKGEGYVRIALVQPEDRLQEAVERLGRAIASWREAGRWPAKR
ncbi:aminotransferase [Paenibacillus sp. J31TS4]|uniref:aminotransferase class I/II-fold pyridoxal phosphate-dependent enzyme n=1 Tax=Paenibacillus sp. J31TS4 TaxID=2807195 RepID=UPI001B01A43D|nr:aminotransferase class I/II-fold pyridoxal phosphate-dependent enzyme [Paenibacillus sp. J31TS4]GIP38773.1 aminotransferase [Paenibacillus sp. J31TS4]